MTKEKLKDPPKFGERILSSIYPDKGSFTSVGDFREEYLEVYQSSGPFKANLWYWKQIAKSLPNFIRNKIHWNIVMIHNYLKIALRSIKRQKVYSFVNLTGLAIGIACSVLIFLYIKYEYSYDKYHDNANDIYRVITRHPGIEFEGSDKFNFNPAPLAPTLMEDFPEVISSTRFRSLRGIISYKEKRYYEERFFFVEPTFFDIFTFPLISGDPRAALNEPFSMLITEEMVDKYFGSQNPIGKILNVNNNYDYKITGILKNIPKNSHFSVDFLASFQTLHSIGNYDFDNWENDDFHTYILLQKNFDPNELEKKLPLIVKKHRGENSRDKFLLQPLTNIHLHGNIAFEIENNSDIRYVYLLSAIAFLIILIACFNYLNLSTTQTINRSKEIGIRKIVGADRHQIIYQFLVESIVFVLLGFVISILLVITLLPSFSSLMEKNLSLGLLKRGDVILGMLILILLVGVVSGSYLAFLLSSLKPINTLKCKWQIGAKSSSIFRNCLVTAQFVISIVLIVCTLIIYKQLVYIKNHKMGFDKENIVTVHTRDKYLINNYEALRNELNQDSRVACTTVSSHLPSDIRTTRPTEWEGKTEDEDFVVHYAETKYDFIDFYGLQLIDAHNFIREFTSNIDKAYILNETAVKALGWDKPVGKRFNLKGENRGVVVGVIKDFHFNSLHSKIKPLALRLVQADDHYLKLDYFSIKINSNDIPGALAFIEKEFKRFSPKYPYSYSFIDESVDRMYYSEKKLGQFFNYFTLAAVFIACLGLFGLASFSTEKRTKEIGVRKVLGASVSHIILNLTREFIKWVAFAYLVALPVAYISMHKWLQNFAYRIHIGMDVFFLSGAIALFISLLAISYQSVKAAAANPVDSLRYE